MKVIEKYKKQLTKSDEFIKNDFNINRGSVPLKKKIYKYIYVYLMNFYLSGLTNSMVQNIKLTLIN